MSGVPENPVVLYDRCLDDALALVALAGKHSDHWTPDDYSEFRHISQRVMAAFEMRANGEDHLPRVCEFDGKVQSKGRAGG